MYLTFTVCDNSNVLNFNLTTTGLGQMYSTSSQMGKTDKRFETIAALITNCCNFVAIQSVSS